MPTLSEESPLLDRPAANGHTGSPEHNSKPHAFRQYQDEVKSLLKYTLPIYWAYILEYTLVMSAVIAVGHISSTALAASTLATMTATVTGFSIVQGFASGLDTVLPSAWTSAHPEYVGLWTHRMSIIMAIILVPISVLWLNAEKILIFLGQEPEIAALSGLYLRWMVLGLPAEGFNAIARRYFQSQGLPGVPPKVFLVVSPLNALIMYLLVWGPPSIRLGFIGAPIASAISSNTASLCFVMYALYFTSKTSWHPVCHRSFTMLPKMFKLGLVGVAQLSSDWWSWELMALAASFLGPSYLAAQSILLVTSTTMCLSSISLGLAAAIRIGNLLGKQNASKAKISSQCILLLAVMFALVNSTILMYFRKSWGRMFNNDPDVISLVARILPVVAFFQIVHCLTLCTGGILRASNKFVIAAFVTVTAFYVIGIPFGIWLAFWKGFKLYGLWTGQASALVYSTAIGVYLCLRTDWELEAKKVLKKHMNEQVRMREDSELGGS